MTIPERIFLVGDSPSYKGASGIPWAMLEHHERQAVRNHSQTLQRLHDRGGLSWCEALAVLEDRHWHQEPNAKVLVLAMVDRWKATQESRIEKAAIVLWHRFAPDGSLEWEDETHKAEFRDAARAALEAVLS